jgi:hypothetical protein
MVGAENFLTNSKTQTSAKSGTTSSALELTQHMQPETRHSCQEEIKRSSRLRPNYGRNSVKSPDEVGTFLAMTLITAVKQGTIAATFQLTGVARSASGNQARAAAPVLQSTFDVCCGFAVIPEDCASDTGEAAQIPS